MLNAASLSWLSSEMQMSNLYISVHLLLTQPLVHAWLLFTYCTSMMLRAKQQRAQVTLSRLGTAPLLQVDAACCWRRQRKASFPICWLMYLYICQL